MANKVAVYLPRVTASTGRHLMQWQKLAEQRRAAVNRSSRSNTYRGASPAPAPWRWAQLHAGETAAAGTTAGASLLGAAAANFAASAESQLR